MKKNLADILVEIDQIQDDEEFCAAEREAVLNYCHEHNFDVTEADLDIIKSRGLHDSYLQWLEVATEQSDVLQEIYDNLQVGKRYGTYYAKYHAAFSTALWTTRNGKYIAYSHFGESAMKSTFGNLQWILTNIFRMSPEKFVKTFPMYDEETFAAWEKIAKTQNTTEYRTWDRNTENALNK